MPYMYTPEKEILDKYAKVLVNFALNSGKGIKKGEVVFLQVPETAKPLLISLYQTVLKSGAYPIIQFLPEGIEKEFYLNANDEQIKFFPAAFLKGKVRQADHFLSIIAESDKHELEGIDPARIMEYNKSMKPYIDWRNKKEGRNKFTWTLGLYATSAMAKEAGLSLKECWKQIIKASYLNQDNPVERWKQAQTEIKEIKNKLNKLKIEKLRIKSEGTDLIVGIGEGRRWLGCDGRNIPSFEVFISPDWRMTEGYVSFDQPLYRYGNIIRDIYLEFKEGRVIKAEAKQGEKVLKEMIKVENADKIGEFSLTDTRFSKISKFMAETLYDENFGGKYGNFHLALGSAYKESYPGKVSKLKPDEWKKLGFNESVIHTDIISTKNRTVTALLSNGTDIVLYKNGKFVI